MSSTLSVRVPRRAPLLAVPLLLPALAAGCGGGNPTCVFVGACGGSQRSDEISGNPAVTPEDGWFILDSRPRVTDVFPSGGNIAASTPVIVVFSESMHPDTVRGAFEIVPVGGNIVSDPVQGVTEALVAENRVLVLLPPQDLDPGAYIVRVGTPEPAGGGNPFGGGGTTTTGTMAEMPTDVTGQELQQNTGVQVGSTFTVVVSPPVPPQLVTAYPFDGSTGASDTAQIVVVVDRPLAATSVSDGSFVVELDGNDPNPDPVASFLDLGAGSDGRVLLWQSAVAGGDPVPLGADVAVEVTLSPSGNRLRDTEGEELATQSFDFRTIPFTTPLGAGLMSEPTDAIGRRNLTPDGNEDLSVQVDLLDAEPGDFLDLFLVGPSTDENDPILVALRRDLRLTTAAPIQSATYGVHAVDLTVGGNPERPRLGDGFVAFAFRLRRGAFVSPLRLLDVDVGLEGIQDPLLDTTAPTILRLGIPTMASGNTTGSADLVSDLSNLAIAGVADETLESVEVTATDGMRNLGNGVLPGVVGSRADGGFVAAPVELGVFDTARAEYTAVAYDRAFNASVPVMGTFTQRGAVGPTPFAPGMDLTVEVFDALTLEPIQGAVAMVHADLGDGVSYPFHAAGLTGPAGTLTLDTGYPGAVGVVLTVEAGGHDLFTFHGVTGTRVSVPLEPSGGATASVAGTVSS